MTNRDTKIRIDRQTSLSYRKRPYRARAVGLLGCAGLFISLMVFGAMSWTALTAWAAGYPNDRLLVDTAWVAEHGKDGGVRILDVRPIGEYIVELSQETLPCKGCRVAWMRGALHLLNGIWGDVLDGPDGLGGRVSQRPAPG